MIKSLVIQKAESSEDGSKILRIEGKVGIGDSEDDFTYVNEGTLLAVVFHDFQYTLTEEAACNILEKGDWLEIFSEALISRNLLT